MTLVADTFALSSDHDLLRQTVRELVAEQGGLDRRGKPLSARVVRRAAVGRATRCARAI
jgi:hypothetical protein